MRFIWFQVNVSFFEIMKFNIYHKLLIEFKGLLFFESNDEFDEFKSKHQLNEFGLHIVSIKHKIEIRNKVKCLICHSKSLE